MRIALSLIVIFITLPIWFFLLYTLLAAAHADRLCWFLFWVYVPFSITVNIIEKCLSKDAKE